LNKKWAAGLLSLFLIAGALTACGEKKSSEENIAKTGETSVDFNKPIELTMTSSAGTAADSFNQSITQFLQKKFPNWKFNYIQKATGTTAQELVTSGTPLDLLFEAHTGLIDGVIKPGLNGDISDLIKKHNVDLSRFEPVTIDGMRAMANGGLYGLPIGMQVIVNSYNKDIFDKFGVPYPKDGMTWDETIEQSKKLTRNQDDIQYLGLVASTGHILKLNPFSIPYVDAKTSKSTYNNEKWKLIMNTVLRGESQDPGYQNYIKNNKNKMPGGDEFKKTKNVGMYVFFSDFANDKDVQSMNFDMVSAPTYKELPNIAVQPYPNYVVLSSISKHKEEAMEVIKYLTSDEYQLVRAKLGYITPLKNPDIRKAIGADNPKKLNWNSVFYNQFAQVPQKGTYELAGEKPLVDQVPSFVLGEKDLNTVMREAEETANKAIANESAK
jgi:ABC-type glycerol-3-phosphate transport system substrate-binding protein